MEKPSSPSSSSSSWDEWVEEALSRLESLKLLRSLRPIDLSTDPLPPSNRGDDYEVFEDIQPWDRRAVEVSISMPTFQKWLLDIPSAANEEAWTLSCLKFLAKCKSGCLVYKCELWIEYEDSNMLLDRVDLVPIIVVAQPPFIANHHLEGDEGVGGDGFSGYEVGKYKKLILFSGNDYLGLSSHPSIAKAAIKAAQEHGMGPRGSALICGYTNHHRLLESSLADLKKKEDCLLCPTGFAANMAFMVALGNIPSLLASSRKLVIQEKIAVFSDALNHASIIDGIRLAERQKAIEVHIYRHCDMSHLSSLLTNSKLKKKVVVTDGLFSMDGDFAPMVELANLRKQHGFLLVIDDAHGTFVCGKDGGGVAEQFNCEKDVDICVGTLSKAAGCHGGFIACSKKWKLLIQSRGRSFIFSTASTVPVVAASHAAVAVAKKEVWRRRAIWSRVQEFQALTGVPITSHVISLVVGNEEKALQASRHLLKSGFHVTAIRPPTVPPNSCRLRVALSAAHTKDDLKKLAAALSHCVKLQDAGSQTSTGHSRL